MSDAHRKDFSTKAKETITPDIMKSDTQKMKESATGTADHVARQVQSDSSMSTIQDTLDETGRAKDNTKHETSNETVGDKIKHAVGLDDKKHDQTPASHTTHTTHTTHHN